MNDPQVETQELKKIDARERSFRTLKQSLLATVAIAGAVVILQTFIGWGANDFVNQASWTTLGVSVIQSVSTAVLSYINRYTKEPVNAVG